MKEFLLNIFKEGIQGDKETLKQWVLMIQSLIQQPFPKNLDDLEEKYKINILDRYKKIKLSSNLEEEIDKLIDDFLEEKIIEPIGKYSEFKLKDEKEFYFYNKNIDYSIFSTDFKFQPLQFIRSKVHNFCKFHNIQKNQLDDIIIAITEAGENAIKYADKPIIIMKQQFENATYSIRMTNSMKEIQSEQEINLDRFSEDISLMRGILIMSKLMDDIDIINDTAKQRVILLGSKKIN